MDVSNFQFLQAHQEKLFELGRSAEGYAYSDPQSAVVKLRCFAELYVSFIYKELSLPTYDVNNFCERLNKADFKDAVEKCVLEKLHLIRLKGNKAVHLGGVSINDALVLVKEAYFLSAWIFMTYHCGKVEDLPQYHDPQPAKDEDETLKADKQRLEQTVVQQTAELQQAKAELAEAEKQQQEALAHLASINNEVDQARLVSVQQAGQRAVLSYDFEIEETRRQINMEDVFAEYQLTAGQSELVTLLERFLSSRDDNVFLLKGYAGTGKTFITKGLTEYFQAIGRNYILAAPTGKASKVIASKTRSEAHTIHKTIYSFKDIKEYTVDDLDGSETYKYYADLAVNEYSVDTVYIVDESSMISDIYNEAEFFRFGSGYLLQDLLKFVNLDHNDHRKKLIFIGDDAQLPPVGMRISPALNAGYLLKEFGLESTGYELTEVVRQKADSGVMHNALAMRKALKANVFNQIDFDLGFPDLSHVDYSNLIARYLESCAGKINAESIIIAHSNADVAAYNKRIREEFFPGMPEVCAGDKVMAVTNSDAHGLFICNGDFGLIRQVFGKPEHKTITITRRSQDTGEVEEILVPLEFRDVEAGFRDLDGNSHFFHVKIVENLLYSDAPNLSSDENKALYLDFCIRHSHLKRESLEFKETLRSDPYFKALRLKFGYAITCHKAQGSEWNHVFVKCKTHQSQLCAEYFRWLYTAITRTASHLYLLDEPHIKLGGGMKRVSNPGFLGHEDQDKGAQPGVEEVNPPASPPVSVNIAGDSEVQTFGIPSSNEFLLALLEEVKRSVASAAIDIQGIEHQQYQEAYFFARGAEFARINFPYNGKQKIGSVTLPIPSELGSELLELLHPLNGRVITANSVANQPTEIIFDEPFLEEFYQRIKPLAEERNIVISNVEQLQYRQRYHFTRATDSVALDISYKKNKCFSNFEPIRNLCSSDALLNEALMIVEELR